MFLTVNDLTYHVIQAGEPNSQGGVFVFLHGFTGCAENWLPSVAHLPPSSHAVMIDLPGHGRTTSPTDPTRYSMGRVAADINAIFDCLGLQDVILWGYSMGGRLALYYALNFSHRLSHLVLESASPGLATEQERQERITQDNALAEFILREGVEAFVNRWESLPLFASQKDLPPEIQARVRAQRLSNHPFGLASSLRGMGTGVQPSLWGDLIALTLPVTLLAGALDTKFVHIARQMQAILPSSHLHIIGSVGHAIHLEYPQVVARG